jgi:uncharacterized protein YjbI with pentapeptide repeats
MTDTREELLKQKAEIEEKLEALEKTGYVIKNRFTGAEIYASTKDNVKDAVIEAVENDISLQGADLQGANLKGADLGEANLWGANLKGADLQGANLKGADLQGANLKGADLQGANLKGADLKEANLKGADLWGANLKGADLGEANLWEANLKEANLWEAKFYGKGGTIKLKKDQVEDFLNALGFQIEE